MPGLAPMSIETGPRREGRSSRSHRGEYSSALEEEKGASIEENGMRAGHKHWCDRHPKLLAIVSAVLVLSTVLGVVSMLPDGFTDWLLHDVVRKRRHGDDTYIGISDPRFSTYAAVGAFRASPETRIVMGGPVVKEEISDRLASTWETRIDNGYPSVHYNATTKKWQIFYTDCEGMNYRHRCASQLLLYAESEDGWNSGWTKPLLWNSSDPNNGSLPEKYVQSQFANYGPNVVAKANGVGVFLDPLSKKYVAFGEICINGSTAAKKSREKSHVCPHGSLLRNIVLAKDWRHWITSPNSAHVINWTASPDQQRWDCHNNIVYEPQRKVYLATTRTWSPTHGRQIGIAAARKLKKLYQPRSIDATLPTTTLAGSLNHQTYSQVTVPWHDIFLGFVSIFDAAPREAHPTTAETPTAAPTLSPTFISTPLPTNTPAKTGSIHCRLAYSTEPLRGWRFADRYNDFIPLGSEPTDFDSSVCFAAAPVFDGKVERIYYFGGNKPHSDPNRTSALGLATIQKDRFIGLQLARNTEHALITTKPLVITARYLALTFDAPQDSCLQLISVRAAPNYLRKTPEIKPQPEYALFCGQNFTDHRVLDLAPFLDHNYDFDDDDREKIPILVSLNLTANTTLYTLSFHDDTNSSTMVNSSTLAPTSSGSSSPTTLGGG